MAYFLRGTKRKNGDMYYQIYDSYYSQEHKKNMNRSIRKLGLLSELRKEGESDEKCVERLRAEVKELDDKRKKSLAATIDDRDLVVSLGHFLMTSVVRAMDVSKKIDLFALGRKFRFSPAQLLFDLAYARTIRPCSKWKTKNEVFPAMYGVQKYGKDPLYDGLEFLGSVYQEIIELMNDGLASIHRRRTDRCYFDCTNFYFEIDLEDDFRRKGPSKENRPLPLVGMALLLDAECIPLRMELFPGNQSEKPFLPKVIQDVKSNLKSNGKIIEIADKGLNCTTNIITALARKDGYIFSKSIKAARKDEFDWVFEDKDWEDHYDQRGRLDYRTKEKIVPAEYTYKCENGKEVRVVLQEKRIATFNPDLRKKQLAEIGKLAEKAANASMATIKKEDLGPCGKYAGFSCIDPGTGEERTDGKVVVTVNDEKIKEDIKLAGYNILVSSEINMSAGEIYDAYHQLWNIERTFRVMKTQLLARPANASKEDCIKGHYLSVYTAVLILRVLEKWMFKGRYSTEELIEYIRRFQAYDCGNGEWINLMKKKDAEIGEELREYFQLPVMCRTLDQKDLKQMFDLKFQASSRN